MSGQRPAEAAPERSVCAEHSWLGQLCEVLSPGFEARVDALFRTIAADVRRDERERIARWLDDEDAKDPNEWAALRHVAQYIREGRTGR